jgi:retinol-binding protein 3
MQSSFRSALLTLVGVLLLVSPVSAQGPTQPDMALDGATRRLLIDGVLSRLNTSYVFPEKAAEMETAIRARVQRGEYEAISSARVLADSLTAHLRAVSRDKHIGVHYSARPIPTDVAGGKRSPEMQQRMAGMLRFMNFGFEKIEHLEGNVGYLKLRGFAPVDIEGAEDVVAAAMNFLARTDALIFDLRDNSGGEPEMVRLISSYLFAAEPVHLNSLYWRTGNRTEEFWTLKELAGARYGPDRPVYVLTSDRTFSAAEEFSYNLKSLKRAMLIGETTGGGAHPGGMERVTENFGVWVPSGRAINPITKTNWEGTGVEPDVKVGEEQALTTAYLSALRAVMYKSSIPQHKGALEQIIRKVEARTDD